MNELALFAGAGGGILGGKLLGWNTIAAVEYNAYARNVLLARQNDGTFKPFPVWDDVRTFDGRPWRGIADVVSGGFPCQDISTAGRGDGLDGERSGLWSEMARIIWEVRPKLAFVENSPALTSRGLGRVLGDLASMGFDAEWGVLGASACGAHHVRERIWILAHANRPQCCRGRLSGGVPESYTNALRGGNSGCSCQDVADASSIRQQGQGEHEHASDCEATAQQKAGYVEYVSLGRKWPVEPGMGRVVDGMAHRSHRLKAIGNGQVPRVAATAFSILAREFK